jgi:uncharacterized phage-associated protein
MPLGQRFDAQKAIEAILYVASRVKDPTFHRVSKLLYFADKQQLSNYGCVIVGDDYVAMRHGPVPSRVYDILKAVRDGRPHLARQAERAFEVVDKFHIRPRRDANLSLLSDADVDSLNAVIGEFGRLSFNELTHRSHDAAWQGAGEDEFIGLEDIARTTPGGAELVAFLREQRTRRA